MQIIRFEDYHIHYKWDGWMIEFQVYPISDWSDLNGNTGICYHDNHSSDTVDPFDPEHARMLIHGSYCWRGVWESRIYVPEGEEFWGEELEDVTKLFTNHIRPWAESFIKKEEQHADHN